MNRHRPHTLSFLFVSTCLIFHVAPLSAGDPTASHKSVTKACHAFWFPGYKPAALESLADLPEPIRERVASHLDARLGAAFATRLHFARGQVVNVDDYRRAKPDSGDPPFVFELEFKLRIGPDDSVDYCSLLRLDAQGNVTTEIELPPIALAPEKAHVVSASRALEAAESLGVPVDRAELAIQYDKALEALVYRVTYQVHDENQKCASIHLRLAAHDLNKFSWSRTECPQA